ncbi:MAG: RagB/SusD family nutrient uptake outer membrane protein [Bacteroidota bacterium]
MKTINYILLIAVISISACEDFLEEDPRSLVTVNNFYNNIGEATKGLYGSYHHLEPIYESLGVGLVTDMSADVLEVGGGAGGSQSTFFEDFTYDAASDIVNSAYDNHYVLINSVNTLLAQTQGNDLGDDATQAAIEGEAKFLRGLAYFNLVRLFGGVPLRTEPTTSTEGLDLPRASEEEVYQQVIIDLSEAVAQLPEVSLEPGRANQIAANTLLAKVQLTRQNYAEAVSALEAVRGKRMLYEDFADNFKIENENNTVESIFEVQYGLRPENSNILEFLTPDAVTGFGFVFGVYKAEDELVGLFTDDDTRRAVTLWNEREGVEFGGEFIRKFSDGLVPGIQAADAGQINYPVLRYADALLMYAEALNGQNNGPTALAYEAIDEVRTRAGLSPLATGLDQTDFLETVLEERQREFVAEGQRWFDLKRNNLLNAELADKGFISGKNELWPIPLAALDANESLEQNNGY